MAAKGSIKFVMMMQSNCPIFQWGSTSNLPVFEQLSMNISGFFGAFSSLIKLLQANSLLSSEDKLNHVKFSKTHIIFRDSGFFQSIYVVESLNNRTQKFILQSIKQLEKSFLGKYKPLLENWDHNIEPFREFKRTCDELL